MSTIRLAGHPATPDGAGMECDRVIDLRDQACPMTFVRTRLALESMAPGQTLLVLLDGVESQARVPLTVRQQGHVVLRDTINPGGTMQLIIRKEGQGSALDPLGPMAPDPHP